MPLVCVVDRELEMEDPRAIGGMEWRCCISLGHSMGGIALYHRKDKILIPGDVVYADYAIGRFDLFGADPADLKKSLYRLADLEVDILLPGHNQIATGVSPDYIRKTAKMWEPYLT